MKMLEECLSAAEFQADLVMPLGAICCAIALFNTILIYSHLAQIRTIQDNPSNLSIHAEEPAFLHATAPAKHWAPEASLPR